ncbi:hypothetical protein A4S06_10130 [Erysipelotrichaceae bacterium MTC7]|nr:hypothetical protein A4S06_10130 [Erysipelotrichaceae bacterium MTC7]
MPNKDRAIRFRELMYMMRRLKPHDECSKVKHQDMMFMNGIMRAGKGEPIKVSQIAKMFRFSAPAASQVVRRLEERGFVERIIRDDDRRSVYIQVTDDTKRELRRIEDQMNQRLDHILDYLGDHDTEELMRIMEKVVQYMDEEEKGTLHDKNV